MLLQTGAHSPLQSRKKKKNTVKTNFRKHAEEMFLKEPTGNEIIVLNQLFLLLHGLNCDLTKKNLPCWREEGKILCSTESDELNQNDSCAVNCFHGNQDKRFTQDKTFKQAVGNTAVSM